MAQDYDHRIDGYLKIDEFPGEAKDSKHKGEIEILSHSFKVTQPGSFGSGGGGGSARAVFEQMTFVHIMDKAFPKLFEACATGKHFPKAVFSVRKAGGDQVDYQVITMSDCFVTACRPGNNLRGLDLPAAEFHLDFAKIEYKYSPQNSDGTLGGAIVAGYDKKKQKVS